MSAGQARGREKRARIVEAAAAVALAQGVAAVSHRGVAAEAGVPLGSTTYYFASLDELRAAAIGRLLAGDSERRAEIVAGGLAPEAPPEELAWHLIDLVFGTARLDDPPQVALLYERLAEASRAPELAEVVQAGQRGVEADAAALVVGSAWAHTDPGTLVAIVDGRAIGWLALGETQPHVLVDRIAADLRPHAAPPAPRG